MIANPEIVAAAFLVVVSNAKLPSSCGHIPLPLVACVSLINYGPRARGMYPQKGNIVYLDTSVCDDKEYMQHEMMHYVQFKCHLPFDEKQAEEAMYYE